MNLDDNCISKIENLGGMPCLETLQVKRNRIGDGGLDDVVGLLEIPSLHVLNIQDNRIEDGAILPEIFKKMPNLSVLYCFNNKFCKKISPYKKTMISELPLLKYLDD